MATENDDQLVERLVPKILSSIRAKAKAVESLDIKHDLEGITSLPAYDTTGGQHKTVLVSIEALKLPAVEAGTEAKEATEAANAAAANANEATVEIRELSQSIVDAEEGRVSAENARVSSEQTRVSNETARKDAESSRVSAEKARVTAENTRESNESARVAAENARVKVFSELKSESEAATNNAISATDEMEELSQSVTDAEAARVAAETKRVSSENTRVSNESARNSAEYSRVSAESARVTAENTRKSNESARVAAENARVKEFSELKSESEAATVSALDTANHPTYVGEDNYVYKWNKTAQTYDKTSVYVRGEAFSIKKVYASVSDMYADTATTFKEGDFCLINTNNVDIPENAQLFVRNSIGSWDFLVDMSGAIGFTGKVPQLFIGTVSVGSGKNSAAVTLTPDGTDADGNPRFNINYVIPCLAYEDLTSEQIEDLQRPAKDMIAQLELTDEQVNGNEQARIAAENKRVSAETSRQDNESSRKTAETERVSSESNRVKAEADRVVAENARVSAENTRKSNESSRQEEYNEMKQEMQAATKEAWDLSVEVRNTPKIQDGTWWIWDVDDDSYKDTGTSATARSPMISNGTWWTWDDATGEYVDTGQSVNSTYQLTKENIEEVFRGDINTHTHTHLVYRVQVYDVVPDFAGLTSWIDRDGAERAFIPGNDIYVMDANEPTGYANYKLAITTSGNAWVRIPQIPEGFRVVYVQDN